MAIMNNIISNATGMTDETIVNDLLAGEKGAATMYLNATLECATPELKTLYSGSLNQVLESHSATTALAVDHRWYKPYDAPEQQLAEAYKKSVSNIEYNK